MSRPAFIEFRPYGDPKRLEWLLVQATAFKAGGAALTGVVNHTLAASEEALLAAVNDGLLLLIGFAIVAGATSVFRASPPALKAAALLSDFHG